MIDKNQIEIFRDNYLNQYLRKNYSFWKLNKIDEEKFILVDLTLSTHPMHAIVQCILVNNFRKITGYDCKAIINKNDILTKLIAKVF